jgi:hypothetical protein
VGSAHPLERGLGAQKLVSQLLLLLAGDVGRHCALHREVGPLVALAADGLLSSLEAAALLLLAGRRRATTSVRPPVFRAESMSQLLRFIGSPQLDNHRDVAAAEQSTFSPPPSSWGTCCSTSSSQRRRSVS